MPADQAALVAEHGLAARPCDPPQIPGEQLATRTVTTVMVMIAALTFLFSFGNVWALGLRLGVPSWIAPLVAPAVDLSVVGLLVAIRCLITRGVDPAQLRPARLLLVCCGLCTVALNAAEPILQRDYGRAAFDAVGPMLLIGWSEVGPRLLYLIHQTQPKAPSDRIGLRPTATTDSTDDHSRPAVVGLVSIADTVAAQTNHDQTPVGPASPTTTPYHQDDDHLLEQAHQIDQQHRARHGKPAPAETLRTQLRVGSIRARHLAAQLRTTTRAPEAARHHQP